MLVTLKDDDEDEDGPTQMPYYRCEFGCCIDQLIAFEERRSGTENDAQDLFGTDRVFTVERF